MPKHAWLALFLAICIATPCASQESVETLLERKTLAAIAKFDSEFDGAFGMAAIDLNSGRMFSYHGNTVFAQASSIKIPILVRAFQLADQGKLNLDERITMTRADIAGGSGELQKRLAAGDITLTWREVATAMIESSDNAATNKLIARVEMASVNRLMDEMGFLQTRLRRIMIDSKAAQNDLENVSTPIEMARLVELLYHGKAVNADASKQMLDIMSLVKADMRKAVPEAVRVSSKPGGLQGVSCETGIVFLDKRPFALSVMGTGIADGVVSPVGPVTQIVLKHFERLAKSNSFGHRVWE